VKKRFWPWITRQGLKVPFGVDMVALYYVMMDPKTPLWARATIATGLGAVVLPLDLIPDWLAGVGQIDDAAAVAAAMKVTATVTRGEHKDKARAWMESRKVESLKLKTRTVRSRPPQGRERKPPGSVRRETKAWRKKAARGLFELQELGFRFDPRQQGCGMFGCVFAGRPYVIKITGDPTEAANAHTVMQAGQCLGVVHIYAVYGLSDSGLYAILMEPLEPLTKREKDWVDEWALDDSRADVEGGDMTQDEYEELVEEAMDDAPSSILDYLIPWRGGTEVSSLVVALDCMYDLGIEYTDGHSDNVMARVSSSGVRELVYVDLGFSSGPSTRVPVLHAG